jgi:hypothetical protein
MWHQQSLSMDVAVDGGSSNGIFANAIKANEGMVVAASTAAAQLTTTTSITSATISQRCHCRGCHCIIIPPSHCRLHQQHPPLMKITIAAAPIDCCFHQQ